tara:strand:- start:1756 stop:3708 length:1953 start_codon:yes stop_codon:yes gene_type:complete
MEIDYGWTHAGGVSSPADPDAALAAGVMGGSGLRNSYATFLNGMNRRELFMATNASYSFGADGTIAISISLSTVGGDRLNSLTIGEGTKETGKQQRDAIQQIVDAVNEMRQKIVGGDNARAKAIVQKIPLNSTATADRALTLNKDTTEKLDKFLAQRSKDRDIKELQALIDILMGSSSSAVSTYHATINAAISKKKALMKKNDPWIRVPVNQGSVISPTIKNSDGKYISFAKILLHFVAQPIVKSGNFEEVQVIFYAINAKASFVRGFNLAQYPINLAQFEKSFEKLARTGLNMPLSSFMGMLRNDFISNEADYPYGLNKYYTMDEDGYKINEKKTRSRSQTKESIINNAMNAALRKAYGFGSSEEVPKEDLEFQIPKLAYHVEAIPLAGTPIPKTLLRIQIYDGVNSGNTTERQLIRSAVDNSLGVLGTYAGEPQVKEATNWAARHSKRWFEGVKHAFNAGLLEPTNPDSVDSQTGELKEVAKNQYVLKTNYQTIKRFVSFGIPTIEYGSNCTAILGADVQTMGSDLMATIAMQSARSNNPSGAPGAPGGGPPMAIMPTKVSLETMGCPLFEVGQEFFIDFGTGTSIDNVYQVLRASHTIKSTGFTTDVDLVSFDAYAKWVTTAQTLQKSKAKLDLTMNSLNKMDQIKK